MLMLIYFLNVDLEWSLARSVENTRALTVARTAVNIQLNKCCMP